MIEFRSKSNDCNPKIFVIGRNRTGTTSIADAVRSLGYSLVKQRPAKLLIENWAKRRFNRLNAYCQSFDAFQDIPFSLDYTYQAMDHAFPASKFILSVRNDEDQ